ncbi:tRNA (mnm(5)s(2)U34)-methyltransferase, chloroplastic [Euphorbia lathyris]|uniref:tRNA (mnm(5)s(2)U34)-methyltransferase, chloroplastic n=1 Tax=Euphorbia lathyris TaxID=212925 RepID=UPI003313AA1C
MLGLRCISQSNYFTKMLLTTNYMNNIIIPLPTFSSSPKSIHPNRKLSISATHTATFSIESPISGLDDDLVGYVLGKKKATEVAHLVWKNVVKKGDTVIDATCGNGYDTVAMLKMVADESFQGRVYSLDIQRDALESASLLLDENVTPEEKQLVNLVSICHSRMEEIVPKDSPIRLVAFNLGYLPGGDKAMTTLSETTVLALEAAKRILLPGGLISLVVYVGHLGGREELESVENFASELPVDEWICSKFQMLNRPVAPVLVFLFKR